MDTYSMEDVLKKWEEMKRKEKKLNKTTLGWYMLQRRVKQAV